MTEAQLAEWERLAEESSIGAVAAVAALAAEVRRLRRAEHDLRALFQQKLSAAYLEAARLQAAAAAAEMEHDTEQ